LARKINKIGGTQKIVAQNKIGAENNQKNWRAKTMALKKNWRAK